MTDSDIYWTFVTAQQVRRQLLPSNWATLALAADPINKRLHPCMHGPMMVATYGTASRLHQTLRAGVAA
jgi:hypothetical protein